MAAKLKYRPEIDGLRAVAVLAVILFHADVPGMSGGYVGVDVFFVLSGYLITGILLRELDAGQFSIASFYERRIRRILPALFLVLVVCIPVGWFLMNPYAFWRFGQGLVAVTLFSSNILYWQTTNYFTEKMGNPLLHTWSLGVEEQFYLFFPLLLMLVWRFGRKWLWWAIGFIALASLAISQVSVASGAVVAAYYLAPSRAFELMVGSMVAMAAFQERIPELPRYWNGFLGWAGLAAILWGVGMFTEETPFPGLHALIPTLGTAAMLAFVRVEDTLGRLLSMKLMVTVGLVSYSAYLWHQPIFAFVHIAGFRPGSLVSVALGLASVVLAWLSWRYVEGPFRDRQRMSRRTIFRWAAISSGLMIAIGVFIMVTHGVSGRFTDDEVKWWQYTDIRKHGTYTMQRFDEHIGPFTDRPGKKVLVIGDSYGQDFANMVFEAGAWQDAEVRSVTVPFECQVVYVDRDVSSYIPGNKRPLCETNRIKRAMDQVQEADIIILVSRWQKWAAELLPQTIAHMKLRPDQRLFVIGPKDFGPVDIRELLALGREGRLAKRQLVPDSVLQVNDLLKRTLPKEVFVDQIGALCGDGDACPLVVGDDKLISYDGLHLTQEGARYLGERVFARPPLDAVR